MLKKYYLSLTTIIFLAMTACQQPEQKTEADFTKETNSINEKIEIPVINDSIEEPVADIVDVPKFIPAPPAPIPAFIGGRGDGNRTGNSDDDHNCDLGTAGFYKYDDDDDDDESSYSLSIDNYPDGNLISLIRNTGSTQGDITLSPTGLIVNKDGTYWANFSATIQNNDQAINALLNIFLVPNGIFNPLDNVSTLVAHGYIQPNEIITINGSGILQNLEKETSLSIFATNVGTPLFTGVNISSWNISIHRICDNGQINPEPIITLVNTDTNPILGTEIITDEIIPTPETEIQPQPIETISEEI
jgi:hypothetical protein